LVAIGAVAVVAGAVRMSESFEVTLQQATPSSVENILVHRIPTGEQLRGIPPAEALMAFLEFVGRAPLVGFHALFDEIMLARAYEQHLGEKIAQRWIDLRELAPALGIRPPGSRHAAHPPSLDESLAEFGVAISRRHQAVADAFGTAQLFQALSQRAASQGYRSIDGLRTLIDDAKWSHR
jgi:DNA polymerase III subunit epsilon